MTDQKPERFRTENYNRKKEKIKINSTAEALLVEAAVTLSAQIDYLIDISAEDVWECKQCGAMVGKSYFGKHICRKEADDG